MDLLPYCEDGSMIPVDLSVICDCQIHDPNGSTDMSGSYLHAHAVCAATEDGRSTDEVSSARCGISSPPRLYVCLSPVVSRCQPARHLFNQARLASGPGASITTPPGQTNDSSSAPPAVTVGPWSREAPLVTLRRPPPPPGGDGGPWSREAPLATLRRLRR